MSSLTSIQFDEAINKAKKIFEVKNIDYGTAWRVLRLTSITDQIYIKARRIRTIEEKGSAEIDEGAESEFIGIVNYCLIGLIQLELEKVAADDISEKKLMEMFAETVAETKQLMNAKNSDYDEAWRHMRVSPFTDMILMRLERMRQIENNGGQTQASEGIDSHFRDMLNYAVFAIIRLNEK